MPWVQILKAKYHPRSDFWPSRRTHNCTKLWRDLVISKPELVDHLRWKIGSGQSVPVFSQPWFPNWRAYKATTAVQRSLKVASLICQQSLTWDFQQLQLHFGLSEALTISISDTVNQPSRSVPDTLIFTFARNGVFSIKKAYQLISGDRGSPTDKAFWDTIWRNSAITPKLKRNPGSQNQSVPQTCPLCNGASETVEHALFWCEFAKKVWRLSPLNLDSDTLQGSCRLIIEQALQAPSQFLSNFVSIMWAIWKVRNDAVMAGKPVNMETCVRYFKEITQVCQTMAIAGLASKGNPLNRQESGPSYLPNSSEYECFVDGSWSDNGLAGVGIFLTYKGVPVKCVANCVQALSPAHAEAIAVLQGYQLMIDCGCKEGVVLSDSKEVVDSLAHSRPICHDWRSFREISDAWFLQGELQGKFRTRYCNREEGKIGLAHLLANSARVRGA